MEEQNKKVGCWKYSSLEGGKKWEMKFDREGALLRVNGVRCKKNVRSAWIVRNGTAYKRLSMNEKTKN